MDTMFALIPDSSMVFTVVAWQDPYCADTAIFKVNVVRCYECEQMPNPFTPNNDRINDIVRFYFPQLGFERAVIRIFDLYGRLVRTIQVPPGFAAVKYSYWDGTDDDGNPLPQGLYIYTIEVSDEAVCSGSVTIAK